MSGSRERETERQKAEVKTSRNRRQTRGLIESPARALHRAHVAEASSFLLLPSAFCLSPSGDQRNLHRLLTIRCEFKRRNDVVEPERLA
jgi:hypothetical protein